MKQTLRTARSAFGDGAAFIEQLRSPEKRKRKGAFNKLKSFAKLLYPHYPWSGLEYVGEGVSKLGEEQVIFVFEPAEIDVTSLVGRRVRVSIPISSTGGSPQENTDEQHQSG